MSGVNKTFHAFAPGLALSNLRTLCAPRVKKFAHPCTKYSCNTLTVNRLSFAKGSESISYKNKTFLVKKQDFKQLLHFLLDNV